MCDLIAASFARLAERIATLTVRWVSRPVGRMLGNFRRHTNSSFKSGHTFVKIHLETVFRFVCVNLNPARSDKENCCTFSKATENSSKWLCENYALLVSNFSNEDITIWANNFRRIATRTLNITLGQVKSPA